METAQCFRALGLGPEATREEVQARYEQRCHAAKSGTESDKLANRVLEENYRACLRLIDEK